MLALALVPLLFLAGCRPSESPAASTPTLSVVSAPVATASAPVVPAPVAAAPALPASPCGGLSEANARALSIDADARPGTQVDLTRACYPTPQGAWGLRLTSWKRKGEPRRAAQALGVHPNTVRYRTARLAEWCDVDLDDPAQRLAVRLEIARFRSTGR